MSMHYFHFSFIKYMETDISHYIWKTLNCSKTRGTYSILNGLDSFLLIFSGRDLELLLKIRDLDENRVLF